MPEPFYVPFEPGLGSERVMTPKRLVARVVKKTPEVSGVRKPAVCDEWFEAGSCEDFMDLLTRGRADVRTQVLVCRDRRSLFIAFKCFEPRMKSTHRLVPRGAKDGQVEVFKGSMPRTLAHDESVSVCLDSAHDKTNYYLLEVNVNGARRARRVSSSMGWTAFPSCDAIDLGHLLWQSDVAEADDHWRAAFKIDLPSIGVNPAKQPTVGLNLGRVRNVDVLRQYSWVPAIHLEYMPGLALGDLYLDDRGAAITRIDWGDVEFGANRVEVTVAAGRERRDVVLGLKAVSCDGPAVTDYEAKTRSRKVRIPAGGEATLEAGLALPDDRVSMRVRLELADAKSGDAIYRATFPLTSHANIRIGRPHRRALAGAADPKPGDRDFHRRKLDWVLSRLPKFRRRTTAQGAPSDFTLMSEDGKVVFDLMKPRALRKIADWICSLFDEDNDRLIAVALFTNDDWVTVHAAPRCAMQYHLTPLSLLRLGGGHCYSRAAIGAGIVNELPDPARRDENHVAWASHVLGHVITGIKRGDEVVYIDPTFGHFFYNRSNTELATARELAADRELVSRVVKGERRWANYASTAAQIQVPTGKIVWPAGAPPK